MVHPASRVSRRNMQKAKKKKGMLTFLGSFGISAKTDCWLEPKPKSLATTSIVEFIDTMTRLEKTGTHHMVRMTVGTCGNHTFESHLQQRYSLSLVIVI